VFALNRSDYSEAIDPKLRRPIGEVQCSELVGVGCARSEILSSVRFEISENLLIYSLI
jgi:hypothetical protein